MTQGSLGAADVRRVVYGLEVGRSVRTAGGAGHIVSPRAQLVIIVQLLNKSGEIDEILQKHTIRL